MGYPLGKAPTQVGTAPWPEEMPLMEGTSPADMRRIIGAQYMNSGILPNGGLTVEGTSSMSYKVNAGACFMWSSYASRLGMLIPVDAVTVNTAPAPSTGTRTDTIYVDGDGVVRVHEGTNPPNGVTIAQFVVPAGVTSTSSAQKTIDRNFAIPTGASLGQLAHWDIPGATWGGTKGKDVQRYRESFTVPSDRLVRVDISASAIAASSGEGWTAFGIEIDGTFRRALHMVFTHDMERTYSGTWTAELAEGRHELTVFTVQFSGPALKTAPLASASEVNVWDAGATR